MLQSATIQKISFLENIPTIQIKGRTFPIEINYLKEPTENYIETAMDITMSIHLNEGEGDILIFLSG